MRKNSNGESPVPNILARGTRLSGEVESEGDIRIDGHLTGKIIAKGKVVVGTEGLVEGSIGCKSIDISGKVEANVVAEDLTVLKSTARIKGDIITAKISIEPGAVFEGHCKMERSDKQPDGKPKK
ncbi:MAG: polymer-forming cytoskeletal protein [Bacteroidales bacterium]|nr:polymer-forming cytoskeletal protein [Bacteroidales bacterium]